jgi:seryl-tRNA synthetase
MHDIRAIRENPAAYAAALSRRPKVDGASEIAAIMALDEKVRAAILRKQEAEQARNAKSKEIGKAKASKDEALVQSLMTDVAAAKQTIEDAGKDEADATRERDDLLARLPNVPLEDAPQGADEHGNVEVRRHGGPRKFNYAPKDHADIGEKLGLMDFEAATRMSGARFVVLKGQLARLERALTQFMLDIQTSENGYIEHAAPLLVKEQAMYGTGQLPKFEEDLFTTVQLNWERLERALASNETFESLFGTQSFDFAADARQKIANGMFSEKRYLIPTAEVSLTNIYREQIVDGDILPVRMTAATPCFRSEAGSAGRDTKGMIRQHQFIKVELVSITKPEDSEAEHLRMTKCAEGILERLGLPYRTVLLCTGDMGFGARKTYDLEVWLPSQNTYREISSCSNCGDFQARRMDARCRKQGEKGTRFVHTLNGSGIAVGRALIAVLENHQDGQGRIAVPRALQPYMGGLETIA